MSTQVVVLCHDDSLEGIHAAMSARGLAEVPVVRDGRLVGRIDLDTAAFAEDCIEHSVSCRNVAVERLLSRGAPAVLTTATIETVEAQLASEQTVYVVEPDGSLVGRITFDQLAVFALAAA